SGSFEEPGSICHTRLTARSDPSLNFGEEEVGFGSLPIRPRYTAGPQGSATCGAAAYTVRPSLGSRPMWYTPAPAKNGPATDDFVLSRRVRTEGGRDPHEDTDPGDLSCRCAGHDTSSRPGHPRQDEKVLVGVGESARAESEGLSRVSPSGRLMDSEEILDVALRLAKQSETPADTTINVPAKDVKRALFGI